MNYNSTLAYNNPGFLYIGSLLLSVPGIVDPITVNNITILIDPIEDYSNNTTIGVVTYSVGPSGIMSFETSDFQAEAIIGSEIITLDSVSGEVTIQYI